MPKKILTWALLAFLVFYVLTNPAGAAATARHIGTGLAHVGTSAGQFLSSVTGGGGQR
jgi:hypothetical protein